MRLTLSTLRCGSWISLAEAMQFAFWGDVTSVDRDVDEAEPLPSSMLEDRAPDVEDHFTFPCRLTFEGRGRVEKKKSA